MTTQATASNRHPASRGRRNNHNQSAATKRSRPQAVTANHNQTAVSK